MSYYISAFKPDGESFFYFLLFHRFHKKIFYPHPERMKRKIKITAPDNPTFRIQGTEMFCRIQPGHTWQCKKHHCRYCFSYPPKKLFLILIDFNQWKNFLFCTVIPDIFRTVLSFLFLISQYGNTIHDIPPLPFDVLSFVVPIIKKLEIFSIILSRNDRK